MKKKDIYRCSNFNCDVFLCRKCFDDIPLNGLTETTYIQSTPSNNIDDDESNGSPKNDEDDSINSSELEEPYYDEEAFSNF